MVREWYILVRSEEKGPFAPEELINYPGVTPDTLVRKKGWKNWIALRFVSELRKIFKDKPKPKPLHDEGKKELPSELGDQAALTMAGPDPFLPYLWLLLLLIFAIYFLYLLYD